MNNIRTFGFMLAAAAGIAGFNAYAGDDCSSTELTRQGCKECCPKIPKVCCPEQCGRCEQCQQCPNCPQQTSSCPSCRSEVKGNGSCPSCGTCPSGSCNNCPSCPSNKPCCPKTPNVCTNCPSREIEIDDLSKSMQNDNVLVVNVLARESFDDCHIAGSISVPFAELEATAATWDKSQRIVTYCAHSECSVSGSAAEMLTELGFENVSAYEGGIKEWFQSGLPTEGPAEQDWLKA